jgi:hypothetical protein
MKNLNNPCEKAIDLNYFLSGFKYKGLLKELYPSFKRKR